MSATHDIKITVFEVADTDAHKVIFIQGIYSGTSHEDMRSRISWLQNTISLDPFFRKITGIGPEDFHFFDYNINSDPDFTEGSYSDKDTCWTIDDMEGAIGQAKRLELLVRRLKRDNPELQQVSILAHSMGGIISTYSAARHLVGIVPRIVIVTFDSPLQGLNRVESGAMDNRFYLNPLDFPNNCFEWRHVPIFGRPQYDSAVDMRRDRGVIPHIASPIEGVRLFTINADPGIVVFVPDPFAVDPATVDWAEDHIRIHAVFHRDIWDGLSIELQDMQAFVIRALSSVTLHPLEPEFRANRFVQAGGTQALTVPFGSLQATLVATWPDGTINMSLVAPDGSVIDPTTLSPDINHDKGSLHELYRIQNPQSGSWEVRLFGAHIPPGGVNVEIQVSVIPDNFPPQVSAGPDQDIILGEELTLPPGTFSHPGNPGPHEATIDWGDTTTDTGTVTQAGQAGTVSGSHTYSATGTYTVEVCLTDNASLTGCDSFEATVLNVPPVVDAGPNQVVSVAASVSMTATFTSSGTPGTHAAFIDWGDGSPIEPGIVTEANGSGTVDASRSYAEPDIYAVEVCVTYDGGGTGCDIALVTVLDVAPVGDAIPPRCDVIGVNPTPPATVTVEVEDSDSGVISIEVLTLVNATVEIPTSSGNLFNQGDVVSFTPPETSMIPIQGVKIDQTSNSILMIRVTDDAGNVSECDPVLVSLASQSNGVTRAAVSDLPGKDRYLTLYGDDQSTGFVLVTVNDKWFTLLTSARTIDVGSAMAEGSANTMTLSAWGVDATVMVSDVVASPASVSKISPRLHSWGRLASWNEGWRVY